VFRVPLQCGRFRVPIKSVSPATVVIYEHLCRGAPRNALSLGTIAHWRSSLIIVLACCAAAGFATGFVLRLPAFIILCLLTVAIYAVFRAGIEGGLELTYHLVLVGIAFQLGYFVAIVTQALLRSLSRSKRLRANNAPRRERERDSHQEG
jgi:hypothetical protein